MTFLLFYWLISKCVNYRDSPNLYSDIVCYMR